MMENIMTSAVLSNKEQQSLQKDAKVNLRDRTGTEKEPKVSQKEANG